MTFLFEDGSERQKQNEQTVTQKHGMGCGVACVAQTLGVTYDSALELFAKPSNAWSTGFLCKDLTAALAKAGRTCTFKYLRDVNDLVLKMPGTIVFTRPCKTYPRGHYLVRVKRGWMNPWSNYPLIAPAKSAIVRTLPAEPIYAVLRPTENHHARVV